MKPMASAKALFPRQARHRTVPRRYKPSILQDYELGRAWRSTRLVRARRGVCTDSRLATPMLDLLAALAIRQARDKGLYSG